jgi:ferredoxin-NADP reductase/predicted pyridoxine 5'-phosphate oxidase superfamily flavin-nucleotide-binding protein
MFIEKTRLATPSYDAASESVFHAGEEAVQRRLGVHEKIGPWARQVVRTFLPGEHRRFYAQLPFLVAAARDESGRPWATLLVGDLGFAAARNDQQLEIEALPLEGDGLEGQLVEGAPLGLLGIDLATRRRNRVNGVVRSSGSAGIELDVGQSFGNCPQYIRPRDWKRVPLDGRSAETRRSDRLTPELRKRIESADTFFIASGHAGEGSAESDGMDASHRGGAAGFVRVTDEKHLVFPDYSGNNHFNTIGNLVVDPRVGLLFVDFETGGMLQLTGRTWIDWDSPEVARTEGARRLVHVEIEQVIDRPAVLPLRFEVSDASRRALTVVDKRIESADVASFLLAPKDGSALAPFAPGQHLPIELDISGVTDPLRRTYSLSSAPSDGAYRISVKRESEGVGSRFLHDSIAVGDVIQTGAPAGEFVALSDDRPIVCVSAGIGATPMVSMLREHVASGSERPIWFVHVARDGRHHPFKAEVEELIARSPSASAHVFYTQPEPRDRVGRDFDSKGRLDATKILDLITDESGSFYLCGPVPFMASLSAGLVAEGLPAGRIHVEDFGPATFA